MKTRILLFVLLIFIAKISFGQFSQLAEINPGNASSIADEEGTMAQVGNLLFFSANNDQTGTELWKTDGTTAGTVLVKDIRPGASGSFPDHFQVTGSKMFFTADDGVAGRELWITDGTAGGTMLLADIRPGTASAFEDWFLKLDFRDFHIFQNQLFFRAYTSADGLELYKSDGTPSGTGLVKSIGFGANDGCQGDFAEMNGALYFAGFTTNHGGQIWKTDGTEMGTVEVTTTLNNTPEDITTFGNLLLFKEDDGINGSEIWKTDGTTTGLLKDTETSAGVGGLAHSIDAPEGRFFVSGTKAYFSVVNAQDDSQIWVTDGSAAGTKKLKSVGASYCPASHFTQLVNNVLFIACDFGDNLWKTSGAIATTQIVMGYSENGILPLGTSSFPLLHTHDAKIWFGAEDFGEKVLFQTAGAATNTMVVNVIPGVNLFDPQRFFSLGDKMIFWAKLSSFDNNLEPFIYKPQLVVAGTVSGVKCNGGSDGSIQVQPAGNPPFLAEWQPASVNGLQPTGLSTGNYSVTVTDANGLTGSADFQVTEPPAIQITFTSTPETDGNQNGTATINSLGGTAPFQFLWNTTPPQTTQTASGLPAGIYICTVTDANACTKAGETVINASVATNEPEKNEKIWLSPNPASNWISLKSEPALQEMEMYRLLDFAGKQVRIFNQPDNGQLSLDGLADGIYILQFFETKKGWKSVPFLKAE